MPFLRILVVSVFVAVVSVAFVFGHDPPPRVTDDDATTPAELPKHFILNPDRGRTPGYPVEIVLKEIEIFLRTRRLSSQGCGGGTWENTPCGMFWNGYKTTKTPWLKDEVALDAGYAQTKTGTFLKSLKLGRNEYARPDRNNEKLTWQSYDPEFERQEILRILFGYDSAERKQLLTKIKDSFENLDLAQFPVKSRELLKLRVQKCENDQDPAVVTLAKEIQKTLTLTGPQP